MSQRLVCSYTLVLFLKKIQHSSFFCAGYNLQHILFMRDFEQFSYASHTRHLSSFSELSRKRSPLAFLDVKNSIQYWRQLRVYRFFNPFLSDTGHTWLTVGDGFGWDANYLHSLNQDVHASDLEDGLLFTASKEGLIGEYSIQNAEFLQFHDGAFDYVVCKDSIHHFPRPYVAIYEMLRVAREAVILEGPQDPLSKSPGLLWLKNILDKFHKSAINRIWKTRFSYEPVGNYVYKLSENEMEKVAVGLNLPMISFFGLNDYFEENPLIYQDNPVPFYFHRIRSRILRRDRWCKLGILSYQRLGCVLFKEMPSPEVQKKMRAQKFQILVLPENPYIRQEVEEEEEY
jgi:ubiquinone/menaquinone biosynthesis C-methylase UbiE